MSQHSSLKLKALSGRHRNVLKRYERIKKLQQGERWQDGMSAYGLPKVKSVKVKVKKAKAAGPKAEGAEGAAHQARRPGPTPPPQGPRVRGLIFRGVEAPAPGRGRCGRGNPVCLQGYYDPVGDSKNHPAGGGSGVK